MIELVDRTKRENFVPKKNELKKEQTPNVIKNKKGKEEGFQRTNFFRFNITKFLI
jgi:hypothetical protein